MGNHLSGESHSFLGVEGPRSIHPQLNHRRESSSTPCPFATLLLTPHLAPQCIQSPATTAARPPMPVVNLDGVTKAYDSKVAVRNLSLSIDAGQMFGLLGPNGAGKPSSIRMMMGITLPDSGRIGLFEKPFSRASLDRVGYLPEERGLYKKMKVLDQLIFFGELHGIAPAEARKRAVIW